MIEDERVEIRKNFRASVNIAPSELKVWLATAESDSVGDNDEAESTGHRSGRRIIEIKQTAVDDLRSAVAFAPHLSSKSAPKITTSAAISDRCLPDARWRGVCASFTWGRESPEGSF